MLTPRVKGLTQAPRRHARRRGARTGVFGCRLLNPRHRCRACTVCVFGGGAPRQPPCGQGCSRGRPRGVCPPAGVLHRYAPPLHHGHGDVLCHPERPRRPWAGHLRRPEVRDLRQWAKPRRGGALQIKGLPPAAGYDEGLHGERWRGRRPRDGAVHGHGKLQEVAAF